VDISEAKKVHKSPVAVKHALAFPDALRMHFPTVSVLGANRQFTSPPPEKKLGVAVGAIVGRLVVGLKVGVAVGALVGTTDGAAVGGKVG
jgi:hypothetical protein